MAFYREIEASNDPEDGDYLETHYDDSGEFATEIYRPRNQNRRNRSPSSHPTHYQDYADSHEETDRFYRERNRFYGSSRDSVFTEGEQYGVTHQRVRDRHQHTSNHGERTQFRGRFNDQNRNLRISNDRVEPLRRDASVQVPEYDPPRFRNDNDYGQFYYDQSERRCQEDDFDNRCRYCENSLPDFSYESTNNSIPNLAEPYNRQCTADSAYRYADANCADFAEDRPSALTIPLRQFDVRGENNSPTDRRYFRTRASDFDSFDDCSSSSFCRENVIRTASPPWTGSQYYEDDSASLTGASPPHTNDKNESFMCESYRRECDQPFRIRNQYYRSHCSELPPLIHNNGRKIQNDKCPKDLEYSEVPDFVARNDIDYYVDLFREKKVNAISSSRISNCDSQRNICRKAYSDDSCVSWASTNKYNYNQPDKTYYRNIPDMQFKRTHNKPSTNSMNGEFTNREIYRTSPSDTFGNSYKQIYGKPKASLALKAIDIGGNFKNNNINEKYSNYYNASLKQRTKVPSATYSNNVADYKKTNNNYSTTAKNYHLPQKESVMPLTDKKYYSEKTNNGRPSVKYDTPQQKSLTAYKGNNHSRNSKNASVKEPLATEIYRDVECRKTFYDVCNKPVQKESLPTRTMAKNRFKSPISIRNRDLPEYKQTQTKQDTSDANLNSRFNKTSPPTANHYSSSSSSNQSKPERKHYPSSSSSNQSTPERKHYPDAEISDRFQQKQIQKRSIIKNGKQTESKNTKYHGATHFFDEDSLASGDSTSAVILYSEIPITAWIHRHANSSLQDKEKDNAPEEASGNLDSSKKVPSNPDSSTPPTHLTASKNQEVRISELKSIEAKGEENRSAAEPKSRAVAKSNSNIPPQKATSVTKLKNLYKNPDVKQQVYENADNVLKEMKMIMRSKGMWYGK